ncbi:hypothetical protein Tco_1545705 [Tanacetum coccineum]
MVLTNAKTNIGKKDMKEPVPHDLHVVQPCVPPSLFLGHLKKQKDNLYKTCEIICMIGSPKKIYKKKAQEDEGVTPLKSDNSRTVTLGCDVKEQSTSHRKRPQKEACESQTE